MFLPVSHQLVHGGSGSGSGSGVRRSIPGALIALKYDQWMTHTTTTTPGPTLLGDNPAPPTGAAPPLSLGAASASERARMLSLLSLNGFDEERERRIVDSTHRLKIQCFNMTMYRDENYDLKVPCTQTHHIVSTYPLHSTHTVNTSFHIPFHFTSQRHLTLSLQHIPIPSYPFHHIFRLSRRWISRPPSCFSITSRGGSFKPDQASCSPANINNHHHLIFPQMTLLHYDKSTINSYTLSTWFISCFTLNFIK